MKRLISVVAPSALTLAVLSGCAASAPPPPPAELQDARAALNRAQSGPAAEHNRAGLIEARQSLDAAEQRYDDEPLNPDVKTLGYVAKRQVEVAEAESRAAASAKAETEKLREVAGRSERRAKVALDRLGLAAKEESRGTVITLAGANMFATNQAEILPAAKGRLTDVAKAVKKVLAEKAPQDAGRRILLIGYTDDVGNEDQNADLSERRARAVSDFFSQHGLDDAIMDTQGQGESNPIADNTTAQGRAKNRRVEVIVTPAATPAGDADR